MMRRALVLLCATAVLGYNLPQIAPRCRSRAPLSEIVMGRKFENNKLKMAKTALAYAKKASYIGKKVVIAVKASGDDPAVNRQLAAVMAEANALNVPKDVVTKNIKRAMDTDTANFDELTYEAYGVGGVGIIINCLSDNKNRAVSEVNTVIKKTGSTVASAGSVLFNFQSKGRLIVTKEIDEDTLLELAIEGGCEGDVDLGDVDEERDGETAAAAVITEPTELGMVQSALQEAGYGCSGSLVHVPLAPVEVSAEDEEANYKTIDALEALDDVDSVEHNMLVAS
jgi:YebC/PmpR family DNA-binding regulatory protein